MTIKYTIVRKETFYLNLRLPDGSFYRKSLQTDSPSIARMLVLKVMNKVKKEGIILKDDIDEFIERIITNKLNHVIGLTEAIIDPLSSSYKYYFNTWYNKTDSIRYVNYCSGEDRPMQSYNEFIYTKLEPLIESSPSYAYFHSYSEDECGIAPNEDAPFYYDFKNPTKHCIYLEQLNSEIKNYIKSLKINDSRLIRQELNELKLKFSDLLPQFINKPQFTTEIESISPYFKDIGEGFKNYLSTKGGLSDNAQKEYMSIYREFIPTFEGLRLDEIDHHIIREVWQIILYTPKQNTSNAKLYGFELTKEEALMPVGLSQGEKTQERKKRLIQKRWDVITDDDYELKSPELEHLFSYSALKARKAVLNHVFDHAEEENYFSKSLSLLKKLQYAVKGEVRTKVRSLLPTTEVLKLITHAFTHRATDSRNWVILLMAYHGLRTSEVTNLDASNIIIDEDTSIPYIDIVEGKTTSAPRRVPLHNDIKQDFLSWVKSREDRLFNFPAIKMSVYYDKLREELEIPKLDKNANLLSLYSLRHNFASQLIKESDEVKYRLIGHHTGRATKVYSHLDMADADKLIQSIKYSIKFPK